MGSSHSYHSVNLAPPLKCSKCDKDATYACKWRQQPTDVNKAPKFYPWLAAYWLKTVDDFHHYSACKECLVPSGNSSSSLRSESLSKQVREGNLEGAIDIGYGSVSDIFTENPWTIDDIVPPIRVYSKDYAETGYIL